MVGTAVDAPPDEFIGLEQLVQDGLVQVVSEHDFPNPHIRPWASRRTIDSQLDDLKTADKGGPPVCLYPTPAAMEVRLPDSLHAQSPFCRRLAEGAGALELDYFELDALEPYRNDPRYDFDPWDFGVRVGISQAAFEDPATLERDKIVSIRVGFAYDHNTLVEVDRAVIRRACVFLDDLSSMTPEHQRRWETFELQLNSHGDLRPHPSWIASQMDEWPDGIGPFEKILAEMEAVNQLFTAAFGQPLLRTTDRPERFSWVLRASTDEWDQFVLTLDKLLGDNLVSKALTAAGTPAELAGEQVGTIRRLQWLLESKARLPAHHADKIVAPWREVRAARQDPAHKLRSNVTDDTLVRRQSALLSAVGESLFRIRHTLIAHRANRDWTPTDLVEGRHYAL